MLKLPPDHPQNWFRNAFIHLMDCPHGNWWFYVWHRAYLGYFEQTIRNLSGDDTFAIPYWDWTTQPQIPGPMFAGVLTPQDMAFEPYTGNLSLFTSLLQPALTSTGTASTPRSERSYTSAATPTSTACGTSHWLLPPQKYGISGNMAYAITCGSRYLTRANPKLDEKTAYDVSPFVVYSGLSRRLLQSRDQPELQQLEDTIAQYTARKYDQVSVLEGLPHNKVHNYIGSVGLLDPGPYGNMTNFLSPIDPIFFLHHANFDRLWDVWTRSRSGSTYPTSPPIRIWIRSPMTNSCSSSTARANMSAAATPGEYLSSERFEYDYEPGFGEKVVQARSPELMIKDCKFGTSRAPLRGTQRRFPFRPMRSKNIWPPCSERR